jgi:hypothetical protein
MATICLLTEAPNACLMSMFSNILPSPRACVRACVKECVRACCVNLSLAVHVDYN